MIWQADARIWKDNAAVVVGKTGKIFDPDGLMKTDPAFIWYNDNGDINEGYKN